jgi:hypothetical protein
LVTNIGFGSAATHTTEYSVLANMVFEKMGFPMKHPKGVFACRLMDDKFFKKFLLITPYQRMRRRVALLIRWLSRLV